MVIARLSIYKQIRWVWRGWLVALVLHLAIALPVLAQAPAEPQEPAPPASVSTESVFLEGEFLFEVPGVADLTAAERASTIERSLAPLAIEQDPVECKG